MKKYLDKKHHITISTGFMLFLIAVLSSPSKESQAKKRYGRRQLEIQKSSTKLSNCEDKAELCYQHYDLSTKDWKKGANGEYTEKANNCRNQIHECRKAYMPTKKDCVSVLDQCYAENCQGGICANKEDNIDLALACMTNQNYFFVYGCMIDVEGKAGLWAQKAKGQTAALEQDKLRQEQALKQQELDAQLRIKQAEIQAKQAEAQAQSEVARIQAENERKMAAEERAYKDRKEAEERARKAEASKDPNAEFLKSVLKMKKDLKKLQKHLTDAKSMIGYRESSKKPENVMWYRPNKDNTMDEE